jgi:hypothetical protein
MKALVIDPLQDMMESLAASHAACTRAGWDAQQVKINAIIAAYDQAVQDRNARIPSYLMAAIEVARR